MTLMVITRDLKVTLKQRLRRNTRNLALWTGAWVITMAIANFGPPFVWEESWQLTLSAIFLNLFVGLGMIWANKVYLTDLDELQQKIQLQAMGVTLGFGLICGMAMSNLGQHEAFGFKAEISYLVILMTIVYMIATFIGVKKYQ